MLLIIQYLVLKKILKTTYKTIQTPSVFKLPFSKLKIWYLPNEIKIFHKVICSPNLLWKNCYILHNLGFIEMTNGSSDWFVSITKDGVRHMMEIKLQYIKAICSFTLAIISAILGFILGKY